MLGHPPFGFDIIRKYILTFGTLFNEISIRHFDSDGSVVRTIPVPITFAPKEKMMARILADPNIDRPSATPVLPRIAFELTGINYQPENALRSAGARSVMITDEDSGMLKRQLMPTPYELKFTLWVFTRYVSDGNQIVEQILPFFSPHFTATLDLIKEMEILSDVQVRLDSVTPADAYTADFTTRRLVTWTLEFTMTGAFYGPVRKHPVIKFANVTFHDATMHANMDDAIGNSNPIDRVTVQPGMLQDGTPTSNASESVHYSEIYANDDWDYAVTIFGSLDGMEEEE